MIPTPRLAYTFSDLMIRTKDKKLIKFAPNEVQEIWLDGLHDRYPGFDWRSGRYTLRGCKEDILKARQQGMSTVILALIFLDTLNNPLTQTIIIADTGERAEMLFKVIHRFWQHLPEPRQPKKKYSSKRELEFVDLDSVIYVGTAGQGTVGRGGTINNVLASEFAYWDNAEEVEQGLLESVPRDGNVFRETTANGLNYYYNERQAEHRGESAFIAQFFGWNQTSEYRSTVPDDFAVTDDERKLAEAYHLNNEQLQWRREKKKSLKDMFVVEYPISESEAFKTSGNPYFDRDMLFQRNAELQSPDYDPILNLVFDKESAPRLRNAYSQERLRIWEPPNAKMSYIISADPSAGLTDNGNHSFCSADVLCVETGVQVGHINAMYEAGDFGMMLAELGWAYNTALIGVHSNNMGSETLYALLQKAEYPAQRSDGFGGVYFYNPSEIREVQKDPSSATRKPGFPENSFTKPYMLATLKTLLNDETITVMSRSTCSELITYIKLPGGGAGGETGASDDCVSSLALAAVLWRLRAAKRLGGVDDEERKPRTGFKSRSDHERNS